MKKMTTRKGRRGEQQQQEEEEEEGEENSRIMMKKGPWSSAEDMILLDYVKKNGEGNWNAVHFRTGLRRCGKSCRLRWANHLRPNLKKGPMTLQEERSIVALHARFGNKWAKMAQLIPGRTDNEIKNFWNTRCKRLLRQGGSNPSSQLVPPSLPLQHQEFRQNEAYLMSLMAAATSNSSGKSPIHNMMIMNRDLLENDCCLVAETPSPLPLETQWELPSRQIEMPASDLNNNNGHLLASSSSSASSCYYEAESYQVPGSNNANTCLDFSHLLSEQGFTWLPALEFEEEKPAEYVNPLAFLGGRSLTLLNEENEDACSTLFWVQPENNRVWQSPPTEENVNVVDEESLRWNYPLSILQPQSSSYETRGVFPWSDNCFSL